MNNLLIIMLTYGIYLVVLGVIIAFSWYAEKLDPDNYLPASIWDEILPKRPSKANPSGSSPEPRQR